MNNSPGSILKSVAIAVSLAIVILVTLVLPAEYDIDPLGTGALLGLRGLSQESSTMIVPEASAFASDEVKFVLSPYESVEYKYKTEADASILYQWVATAPVTYDFHGEPENGPDGFAESYQAGKADTEAGSFRAPFAGIHGWYFENRGFTTVTVKLTTSGFYSSALTFRDGFVDERKISPGSFTTD